MNDKNKLCRKCCKADEENEMTIRAVFEDKDTYIEIIDRAGESLDDLLEKVKYAFAGMGYVEGTIDKVIFEDRD